MKTLFCQHEKNCIHLRKNALEEKQSSIEEKLPKAQWVNWHFLDFVVENGFLPGLLISRHTQKLDVFENGRPVVGESRPYSIVILIRRFCIAFFLKRYAKKNWWTYFVKYFIIEALLLFGGTPTHQFLQRFLVHATGVSFRRKYSTPTRQLWKTMRENLHISEKKT